MHIMTSKFNFRVHILFCNDMQGHAILLKWTKTHKGGILLGLLSRNLNLTH